MDRTILAVLQERARSVARRAAPSRFAKTLSGPGVTYLSIAGVAFTLFAATFPKPIVGTYPHGAIRSGPPCQTRALPRSRITLGFVLTAALFRTVDPVGIARTRVQTLGAHKPRRADALPSHVVAIRPVEALTLLTTILAVPLTLAPIRTHRPRVTSRTNALTRLRIAVPSVLAPTVRLTLVAVLALRTLLCAQWSGESGRAVTLAGHGVALAPVQALAYLGAVLAEAVGRTLELAERAAVPLRAAAAPVLGVTRGVVLAPAYLRTVRAPAIGRAVYIARLSHVSLVTSARFRSDTLSMPAARIAHRLAPVEIFVLFIPSAALFQNPFLVDSGSFIHDFRPHSIRRTPGRNGHAPFLVPFLVGNFPRCRHKHLVLFDFFAHVWPFQIIVDH